MTRWSDPAIKYVTRRELLVVNHSGARDSRRLESLQVPSDLLSLTIGTCKLDPLPGWLWRLPKLQRLQLTSFKGRLPEAIGNLGNLRCLRIISSSITSLPPSLGKLSRLHSLHLHGIRLKELPASIVELKSLHTLILVDAGLRFLPDLGRLPGLQHLELHGNSALEIPEEILALSDQPEKIVAYLRDRELRSGCADEARMKQAIAARREMKR